MSNEMLALAACPFCGSASTEHGRDGNHWAIVRCGDCGATGPCIHMKREDATKAWNARSSSAGSRPGRESLVQTIASKIACEGDCQKRPNGCGCARDIADALSLHPSGIEDVQTRCVQSESTTHREIITEYSIGSLRWRLSRHCTCGRGANIDYKDTVAKAGVTAVPCLSCEALKEIKRLDASLSTDASACPDFGFLRSSLNQNNSPPSAGDGEPVAWRHRHSSWRDWDYTAEKPDGPSIHLFEVQALYAHPTPAPEGLREALEAIVEMCPATCEMTLAHQMADIALAALTKGAQ